VFGPRYDLHGGALELLFPHHSNEIAQAEAAYGVHPFVKYWMHSGTLNIGGVKMSKSLKNFITIRDALAKYDPEALRLFMVSTHYRKEISYDDKLMEQAKKNLLYMYASLTLFYNMEAVKLTRDDIAVNDLVSGLEKEFTAAMNDDFNTSLALTKLIMAIKNLRSFAEAHKEIGTDAKENAVNTIVLLSNTLGLLETEAYKEKLDPKIYNLIKQREEFRKGKKFQEADEIRTRLKKEYGMQLEDTDNGPIWYKN